MTKSSHTTHRRVALAILFALSLTFGGTSIAIERAANAQQSNQQGQQASSNNPLSGLRWRNIGPYRGGRSVAVAGVASQSNVYYFGGTGGGVFKTRDGGVNWEPVSDGQGFGTGTVGAIEVSLSDPNVVYVGMGEACIRGNF